MKYKNRETKHQVIEYLQSYFLGIGFKELNELVIDKNNCVLCGTCTSLCPRISMNEKEPTLSEYDPECSTCFRYCPRTYFPKEMFEKELFHNGLNKNYALGFYQKSVVAKSNDDYILKVAQNGGVVSSLLIHAFDKGLIEGVLLTDRDENWYPKPLIARNSNEILSCTGSKYTIAQTLTTYKDAINELKLEKLAFVGMPCQIQAVRKLQLFSPLSEEYGKFKLIIGLYCSSNYSYDLMKLFIEGELGISLSNVKKIDVSRGRFYVYTNDGYIKEIPIKEIKKYSWPSCQYCKDYCAEFADISVGSVGASRNDWNSVLLRTDIGAKLFNDAVEAKKIIFSNNIDISKIEKEAIRKKTKVTQIDKQILSVMELLNISDFEVKIYTTLMSLGNASESMLSKIMEVEETVVRDALQKLNQREWVILANGSYSTVNPTLVINNEIYNLRQNLSKSIERLKTEVLSNLEALYVQNNFNHVRYDENLDLI
ncbi:MAG: Coenzyme F420 hydrogenase/dehydrogenase, beta subunit C-terminal domain [Candidatus Hodarchaeota archaeon]